MEGSSRKMKWKCWFKVELLLFIGILCTVMLYIVYETTDYQYQHTKTETVLHPFESMEKPNIVSNKVGLLPHGIVQARSDMETKPLWLTRNSREKNETIANQNLLAIPSGLRQKENVNAIAEKFLAENFTIILFHYDGNVDGWYDLHWSKQAIHISACNQTKWWFAKRFLHPDVVSIYDYIFIWDEDLGVKNFHPGRYVKIVKSEKLEISQPALDPSQSEIHHMITIRRKTSKVHRKIRWNFEAILNVHILLWNHHAQGWVEGMAPVFSRSAWRCAWYLIQNDLVHGWGMDLKLGYCAQGDPTKTVGVVDSEFIVHKGIQTLGGSSLKKGHVPVGADMRSEVRRQSKLELETFRKRWEKATREDKNWVDPFKKLRNRKKGIPR